MFWGLTPCLRRVAPVNEVYASLGFSVATSFYAPMNKLVIVMRKNYIQLSRGSRGSWRSGACSLTDGRGHQRATNPVKFDEVYKHPLTRTMLKTV
jgi:hypothetical protein